MDGGSGSTSAGSVSANWRWVSGWGSGSTSAGSLGTNWRWVGEWVGGRGRPVQGHWVQTELEPPFLLLLTLVFFFQSYDTNLANDSFRKS